MIMIMMIMIMIIIIIAAFHDTDDHHNHHNHHHGQHFNGDLVAELGPGETNQLLPGYQPSKIQVHHHRYHHLYRFRSQHCHHRYHLHIENINQLFHIWCALNYKVQLATGHGQQRLHVDLHHREHEQGGGGEQVERATLIKRSLAKKARCHCPNPMGEAISFSHPPPTLEKGLLLAAL